MNSRTKDSNYWEEKFLKLSTESWKKNNNILFHLIKKAGIAPHQYEHMYNKLNEWKIIQNKCDIAIWQIQLLSGEESYFHEHASKVNKCNESLLFYAIWSGNLPLAKKYYQNNPADLYKEQYGFSIGYFAVCSQNIELLEWIKTIDSSELTVQKEGCSVAALAATFGYMKSLQWLCKFDFNLLNTYDMFRLLTHGNILLPFIIYLHENELLHLLTDYKYLAYFAVEYDNTSLYKWIAHNKPELLNQLIDTVNMNLLQFAAYTGLDEMFSLVYNHQKNLIAAKDNNGLGFMEYAFLRHDGRVNFALGLSTDDYCFTLNVPDGCELQYSFGELNNLQGLSMSINFVRCTEQILKTNYRIQAINLPDGCTSAEQNKYSLSLLSLNRDRLEKEAKMATTLWLLLTTGIRSVCSYFPKECLELIFKSCFMKIRNLKSDIFAFLINYQPFLRRRMKLSIIEKNTKQIKDGVLYFKIFFMALNTMG